MKPFDQMSIALCAMLAAAVPASAGGVKLTFDHYYDGPAVVDACRQLHAAYPHLTQLRSIGVSEEGRDIHLLTINNPETGLDTDKPGIYVDGAIHGNEIQATEVCLYLAWYLLDTYDTNPVIKELIDDRAFYIIPTVNVDSRARFFTDAGGFRIGRTARIPHDDDRDGLVDEDDYDDLDGDGEILQMRIRDPAGKWKTDPEDPRVMVRVKPGKPGEWRRLGSEGIDNDGDGRLNEDTPGYVDMNRNYGYRWQPRYVQGGAGDFPMSSKVTKAVSDFILTRPNLCFNFAFHNYSGLWVRGPGSKLAGAYSREDVKVYDFLGKEGEKIVPGYRYIIGSVDMYTTHGDFDEWMFSNMGIHGFVGELFMSRQERYRPLTDKSPDGSFFGGTAAREKQEFNDFVNQGTMFRDWKPFEHPQFGEIEIGGWRTFTTRIAPTFMLPEMVHRNASMVIFTAGHVPVIDLSVLDVKPLGNDLHRVRIRAMNAKALPTLSARARANNIGRRDIFRIKGDGLAIVSGGIVNNAHLDNVSYVEHRPHLIFTSIPSFGHRDIQWIVKGRGTADISFDSLKARNRTLNVTLLSSE